MCSDVGFNIDLRELDGEYTYYNYALDDTFFASFPSSDIRKGNLSCKLTVRAAGAFHELDFHIEGTVTVPCDRCLDDMDLPVSTDNRLVVKFGEESSGDDDLLIVDEDNPVVDVSWLMYEFVTLSLPMRHTHEEGQCNAEMTGYITGSDDSAEASSDDRDAAVDPRWSKLTELLNGN